MLQPRIKKVTMEHVTMVTLLLAVVTMAAARHLNQGHFPDARQGRFARSLEQYDIVVPQRVDHQGAFLTHQVHHEIDDVTRRKRDVTDQTVHYKLRVEDRDLHVSLLPNHRLFAPGLVVEKRHPRRYGNVTKSRIHRLENNRCHFVGDIRGHAQSKAALSTCNGLTGVLHTQHGEYFIEPVKGQAVSSGQPHPHLVYRRSALPAELDIHRAHLSDQPPPPPEASPCGVEDTYAQAEKEREKWQEKNMPQKDKKTDEGSGPHSEGSGPQNEASGPHSEGSEPHRSRRSKRSISRERNVETLVVVDKEMMDYYKDEDVENYILTIMNMVSNMFHDVTIGNAVNIVLVRIMYLEGDEEELHITHHADNSLNSFCKWQNNINPKDDNHPNHHDVAILLTRYNICSRMNEPCSTLGLSQVSGMCQPHRSCNINEDTGLVLAYTVAHEIGHNFAMKHDTEHNGCEAVYGEIQHIMSPQLSADASPIVWSNCSRMAITKFLDRDWGYCLLDEPTPHEFPFPVLPAGVMYDTNHQCRLQYGQDAQYCEGIDEICATLWCQKDNKCLTRLEAPAEGTLCEANKWCESGQCVPIGEKPEAIDGNWGEWGEWSACSRNCGAGVTVMERHCNNPAPSNGGSYCLNDRKRYRTCQTEPCEEGASSFRHQQCADFNQIPYKNEKYEWEPINDHTNPCQLRCKPRGKFFSVMLRDIVEDGTPCRPGTRDMCINGLCTHVGCDWGIQSNATEDRCGVCHGDGTSCTTVKEEFKEVVGLGYVEAMVIPAGARNIRVEEVAEANNYLAVSNEKGEFFLNGHWVIQWSGDFEAGGTVIHYKRDGNKESFNAAGPLKEPLRIMLLFQSQNPGVRFEFTVPNENVTSTRSPEFSWEYLDWTHCTASCGGGWQNADVICTEVEAGQVDARFCNISTKPLDKARSCNAHQCPSRWWTGPWQLCSTTCGTGGVHRRTVICTRRLRHDEQIALDDDECDAGEKPSNIEPCRQKKPCPEDLGGALGGVRAPEWTAGPWSETCMGDPCDVQTRGVECSDRNAICDVYNAPPARRQCSTLTCGKWLTAAWSECSRTCGNGIQARQVKCVGGQHCHQDKKPMDQQHCNMRSCPTPTTTTTTTTATTTTTTARPTPAPTIPTTTPTTPIPYAADDHKTINTHFNSVQKKEKEQEKEPKKSEEPNPKLNPHSISQDNNNNNRDKDVKDSNVKEKIAADPTDSSIVSTPLDYISSWFNLGGNPGGGQGDLGGQEGRTLQGGGQEARVPYRWMYASTNWSECSVRCGGGDQTRPLSCVRLEDVWAVEDARCEGLPRPVHTRPCNSQPCRHWTTGKWSECSTTCGAGRQERQVGCPEGAGCDPLRKPPSSRVCENAACIDWVAGPWNQCSKTCGGGEQLRNVQCIDHSTMQPASGCHPYTKPTTRQKCSTEPCLHHSAALMGYSRKECRSNIMSYNLCRQLKRQGRCKNKLIQYRCCRTCQARPDIPKGPPAT